MRFFGVSKISSFYYYFQWLSLDVALGAVISQVFFYRVFHLEPVWSASISLALAVLAIYNVDHWIDSRHTSEASPRRVFYRKNSTAILWFASILIGLGFLSLVLLPQGILLGGGLLSIICFSYLILVYFFRAIWCKELMVTLCYTAGVVLAPCVLNQPMEWGMILMIGQFAGMAMVNLLLFSLFDLENDRNDGFSSIVVRYGVSFSERTILVLIFFLMLSELAMIFQFPELRDAQLVFLVMTGILLAIYKEKSFFSKYEYYRIAGDAIFFLPGLLLL